MNGFLMSKKGNIELYHFSTSSLVKLVYTTEEEVNQGIVDTIRKEYWFEYADIKNLYKALQKLEFGYKWLLED